MTPAGGVPAGFAHRYAAWSLDAACIGAIAVACAWPWVPAAWTTTGAATAALFADAGRGLYAALMDGATATSAVLRLAFEPALLARAATVRSALLSLLVPWLLAYMAVALAWHGTGVASRWQASPGKRAFGLRVSVAGDRPTPARAVARHLAAGLSWLTLNAGHLVALGPTRAALHDRISGTRVLRRDAGAGLPRAARAWLVVQALAGLLLLAWLPRVVERLVLAGLP